MPTHFRRMLPHLVDVYRRSEGRNSAGEVTYHYTLIRTGQRCRFIQKSETFADESGSAGILKSILLLTEAGSGIQDGDQIQNVRWRASGTTITSDTFRIVSAVTRVAEAASHHDSFLLEAVS